MNKYRNLTLDFARGVAVILVIIGHCIQYGSGEAYFNNLSYYSNPLFKYIYSFHMPLFAVISGYCFFSTMKRRTFCETMVNRVQRLLIPLIAWQFILNIYEAIKVLFEGGGGATALAQLLLGYKNILHIWFLWSILGLSVGVAVIHYVFRDNLALYVIGFFLTPFIPGMNIPLWLYPFFVGAYLIAKYRERMESIFAFPQKNAAPFILIAAHFLLIVFWKMDYYIYPSVGQGLTIYGKTDIPRYLIALFYRILTGGVGSAMVLCASYHFTKRLTKMPYILNRFSRCSLGFYVFHAFILNQILLLIPAEGVILPRFFLETICVLAISFIVMSVVEEVPLLRKLLLGGR